MKILQGEKSRTASISFKLLLVTHLSPLSVMLVYDYRTDAGTTHPHFTGIFKRCVSPLHTNRLAFCVRDTLKRASTCISVPLTKRLQGEVWPVNLPVMIYVSACIILQIDLSLR